MVKDTAADKLIGLMNDWLEGQIKSMDQVIMSKGKKEQVLLKEQYLEKFRTF